MDDLDFDIVRLANQGFCCSQIVVQLALDLRGEHNPGLIRAMAGLCQGKYDTDGVCGTVTGALCLLAYYGGKGVPEEETDPRLPLMVSELSEWFREYTSSRFGGFNCSDIVTGGQPEPLVCGGLVAHCYGRAMTILVDHGFDPQGPGDA